MSKKDKPKSKPTQKRPLPMPPPDVIKGGNYPPKPKPTGKSSGQKKK